MKLADLLDDETEVLLIAQLRDTPAGAALLRALERRIEKVRLDVENNPTVITEGNVRPDWRWKLGAVEGLGFAEELVSACENNLKGRNS